MHKDRRSEGVRCLATTVAVLAALVSAGPAQAALELRDIQGRPTSVVAEAEFAYDTVLDATWYLTANVTGLTWAAAKDWAAGLTVGTFGGWSLPDAQAACFNDCDQSPMSELYHIALGNPAYGPLTNTGPFRNLLPAEYWSASEYPYPGFAWFFSTTGGNQGATTQFASLYALAIRPGDVAPVPEPETWALLLSGIAVVLVMRRRLAGAEVRRPL